MRQQAAKRTLNQGAKHASLQNQNFREIFASPDAMRFCAYVSHEMDAT